MMDVAWAMIIHGWPFYGVVVMVAGYGWITREEDA